jgi:hypothetical protein
MYASKSNNNINLYNNNSPCDNIYEESNYNYFIYFLLIISCLINLTFLNTNKKKFRIKNIKEQKNISIQTDIQIISLLINPDNNIQLMNNYNQ